MAILTRIRESDAARKLLSKAEKPEISEAAVKAFRQVLGKEDPELARDAGQGTRQ